MSMRERTLGYLLAAADDVRQQVAYYQARAPGLEQRFLASLRDVEGLVLSNPERFAQIEPNTSIRAVLLRRFPFRFMYSIREDVILVVAVAHTAREPRQFAGRK